MTKRGKSKKTKTTGEEKTYRLNGAKWLPNSNSQNGAKGEEYAPCLIVAFVFLSDAPA
jgi:hypothetical protein